jgi:hypothetical protein
MTIKTIMNDNKTERAREYWRVTLKLSPYVSLGFSIFTALLLFWKPQFILIYWGIYAAAIHTVFDYLFWRSVNIWFFGVFYFSCRLCWNVAKSEMGIDISGMEDTFGYMFLLYGSYFSAFTGLRFLLRHSIKKRVGIEGT